MYRYLQSILRDILLHKKIFMTRMIDLETFIDNITEEGEDKCKNVDLHEIEDSQQSLYKYSASDIKIDSVLAELDNLKNIIYTLRGKKFIVDFILLCETFLNDNSQLCKIDGYQLICNNRGNGKGGGVAVIIHENLSYKVREDLEINV